MEFVAQLDMEVGGHVLPFTLDFQAISLPVEQNVTRHFTINADISRRKLKSFMSQNASIIKRLRKNSDQRLKEIVSC